MNQDLIEKYASIFKALANPNRLKIYLELMDKISDSKTCDYDCGCDYPEDSISPCQLDLAKRLGIAPSTISHHLKELKNVGLVKISRNGKSVLIEIDQSFNLLVKQLL